MVLPLCDSQKELKVKWIIHTIKAIYLITFKIKSTVQCAWDLRLYHVNFTVCRCKFAWQVYLKTESIFDSADFNLQASWILEHLSVQSIFFSVAFRFCRVLYQTLVFLRLWSFKANNKSIIAISSTSENESILRPRPQQSSPPLKDGNSH